MSGLADAFATDRKVLVEDGKKQGSPDIKFFIDIRKISMMFHGTSSKSELTLSILCLENERVSM